MQMLNHPHIVRLYEFTEDRSKFYIAMEVVTGGELFDRIAQKVQYSEEDAREVRDSSSDDNTKHSTKYSDEDARGVRYRAPPITAHNTAHSTRRRTRARHHDYTRHSTRRKTTVHHDYNITQHNTTRSTRRTRAKCGLGVEFPPSTAAPSHRPRARASSSSRCCSARSSTCTREVSCTVTSSQATTHCSPRRALVASGGCIALSGERHPSLTRPDAIYIQVICCSRR